MLFADLHLHSRFAFNTSSALSVETITAAAAAKGLGVIGTGDALHPAWRAELRGRLEPTADGLYRLREPFPGAPLLMATVEVSTVYAKTGKTRRVHHLVHLPGLEDADRLAARLARFGNLEGDGRPILKLDSRSLLEIVRETVPEGFFVPAHIWTPWYGVLGEGSGFGSLEDAYEDLAGEIFAVETGLSSDPAMNRRVSTLDRCRMLSGSDAHGPANLGREATVFSCPPSFAAIREALRTGAGYGGTVEFFPEHGKYHWDGHRACGIRRDPGAGEGSLCPVCGKPLTVGVAHRVAALADRPEAEGAARAGAEAPAWSVLPLPELLAQIVGAKVGSKAVARAHAAALAALGPELPLLVEMPVARIAAHDPRLADAIAAMRAGRVVREPGFDGVYGEIRVASGVG